MRDALRVPYTPARTASGDTHLRPQVPLVLSFADRSFDALGLVDSGADVNVLPYLTGVSLGLDWSASLPAVRLSGNLGRYEARGVVLNAAIGYLAPVRLAFAWTRAEEVPLLLGQVNFFAELDMCFFRSQGFLEIRPRSTEARSP